MDLSPRKIISFLKWRLVPVRYLGRARYLKLHHLTPTPGPKSQTARTIAQTGYHTGPIRSGADLDQLQAQFAPRTPEGPTPKLKVPFVNLSNSDDLSTDSPLMRLAFSPDILDVAIDYFGARLRIDSLQVLYSFPNDGPLKESQKWHLDYGDSKSLHCVMYLNDVLNEGDGPFVFIDKQASQKVGRGMTVRRIPDQAMTAESGNAPLQIIYGKAGTSIWIDPAMCYHYGSRCSSPRTAVFVTFNSDAPFTAPQPLILQNAAKIAEVGKKLRPDLDPGLIDRMLGL